MHAPTFHGHIYDGVVTSWSADGFDFVATIHHDAGAGKPWKREDGHGPVSEWRPLDSKRAGERVLHRDGRSALFYDFAEAVRIAKREAWCTGPDFVLALAEKLGRDPTLGEVAEAAATADFENLRAWCRDEWNYVGVSVQVYRRGICLTDEYAHALWGIESTAGDYLNEVALELAVEARKDALATLEDLLGDLAA